MKIIIGYWGIVDDALNLEKYVVPPKNYCHYGVNYHFSYTCTHMLHDLQY